MIGKDEIQEKAREFGIHVANVQRDYVFGWILSAIYGETALGDVLILKGGNDRGSCAWPGKRDICASMRKPGCGVSWFPDPAPMVLWRYAQ